MSELEVEKNCRGFELIEFKDANGEECSLQQSSAIDFESDDHSPGCSMLWLGCNENGKFHMGDYLSPRMHLTCPMAAELVKAT